jgi:signal transduction histidine kinase
VRQVAVAARDPEKVLLLRRLGTEYLPRAGSGSLLLRAIRTAAPQIVPRYREEHLQRNAQDAEHLRILRRLDVTSRVAVPLNLRDRVIGGLVLAHAESRRVYGADDVTLAEELARRCAVAIENATLYAAERRARAQVEQMYAEAQEAVRLRDEFLSVAAHELKTPLTGILGSTQLVLRTIATGRAISLDQIQRRVGVVEQQARRLARLVNQLLEVSQLEDGQLRLRREILDLVAIVEGVAETTRTHAPNHEIEVRATGSVRVAVDPLRLEQVIANLLDNAVKYSPDGGPVVVEVEALPSGAARIRVTDRGIGIPPEQRAHMFDRFYQAHVGVHLSGLGLGLYLSRQIVELHGGTLDVAFPDEGGTTFVVQLPL